jgi:hypothetical protein
LRKLIFILLMTVVVTGLLLVGVTATLLFALKSLITGRKPQAYMTFMRFRQVARQFQERGTGSYGARSSHQSADVVDVQAHEVRHVLINKP